ncbi:hypothetical protein [Nostoc sp.]|uniref:hypothetical protein n=1 Tax=Nostoc sp. TaxID=1180 RepID=UPI002FFBD2F0
MQKKPTFAGLASLIAAVFLLTLLTVRLLNSCGKGNQNTGLSPIDDSLGINSELLAS